MLKLAQWILMVIGAGTVLSVGAAIGYLIVDDFMVRRRQKELEASEPAATPAPSTTA